ncbi:hypothetical protein DL239_06710 [Sedimentitalea sp. CY04]|uniref:Uncharacterized protein n=1 Tax=Parasedimentitalea denitrificans TaxID=2211118 RepID=A0ABX0W5G9_9RHOB|nr:hypothetical protein [Sedimentitalea sp. CY04]NIZ60666.1 hypothetical protein [Sedimentitalea sp. CY04]
MKLFNTFAAVGIIIAGASAANASQSNAIVALYHGANSLTEQTAQDLGCSVYRSGPVFAQQGSLKVEEPTNYAVLTCDSPVLANPDARAHLDGTVAVFEGDLSVFPAASDTTGLGERQYILKLGYYNNSDINQRDADLATLGSIADQRDGHWTNEAFLNVDDAMGMATPDEVVVIYYDTAEQATAFRDNNQDILEQVGTFNRAHLTGFAYLVGKAAK